MCIRGLLLALGIVASVLLGAPLSDAPASATTLTAPTPVVDGNRLVNSQTGATFSAHGANYSSFEYACAQGWGYSGDDATDASAAAMASWGINIVRVPLNEECWLGLSSHDYGTASGYRAAVAAWVSTLNSHGMAVILDLHWNAPPGQRALGQWPMPDSQSPAFWSSVAGTFAANPSVLFDLFNEPYSIWNDNAGTYTFQLTWDCWENGGCKAPNVNEQQQATSGTYTTVGMQALVTAVRNAGANQPILLGGIDYANNLSGWLAHEPTDPDNSLVAAWHNYDGQNSDCNSASCWNTTILPIAASVPIITGEFGETDGATAWFTSFMTWADLNGIGYLPWDWQNSAETSGDDSIYALYTGSSFTPSKPMGVAYRGHLATLPDTQPVEFRTQPAPWTASGFPGTSVGTTAAAAAPSTAASSTVSALLFPSPWYLMNRAGRD